MTASFEMIYQTRIYVYIYKYIIVCVFNILPFFIVGSGELNQLSHIIFSIKD